jgi:hypothetical protein
VCGGTFFDQKAASAAASAYPSKTVHKCHLLADVESLKSVRAILGEDITRGNISKLYCLLLLTENLEQ